MIVDELNNIVTEFINDSNDVVRYLSLNAKSMKMFSIYEKNDWIIVDLKNPKIRFSPIAPFMDVLKSQELTKEKVEPYTYSLQNESFVSYFTKGKTEFRQDVIIMEELFYEKKRCIQTVLELIENYITKPIIILNSQELKEESISLIKLLENNKNLKSKFLFCFNFLEAGFDYESNTFFSEISEKNNYFDLSNVENSYDETVLDNPILVRKSYIVPFETLYNFFTDSINFLSLTGGIAVAEKYLKDAISYNYSVPQIRKIYLLISLLYLYSNRLDDGANLMDLILEEDSKEEIDDEVYFFMAQLLYAKSAFQDALKYVTIVRNKSFSGKQSVWYILSSMIYYLIIQKNDSQRVEEEYYKILNLLKDNLPNNYISTVFVFPKSIKDNRERLLNQLETVESSYQLAKELNNEFALSLAHHWKGIILAVAGKTEESFENYHKAEEIRCNIGETPSIIKIKNGISYEYFLRGNFLKSYDIGNSFVDKLVEIKDYSEILCTLKNIAFSLIYMNHFKRAQEIFVLLVKICKLFDLKEFIFCPLNDILFQKIICDIFLGRISQARLAYRNLIESQLLISDNFKAMFPFIQGMISLEEGDISNATELIYKAAKNIETDFASQIHQVAFIYFQFANSLYKKNYLDEAKKYQDLAMEISKKHSLVFYIDYLSKVPLGQYNIDLISCDNLNVNLAHLEELASREQLLNTLHKRVRDSLFLNKLTDLASVSKSREEYVVDVAQSIFEYMLCDSIYIAEKVNDDWDLIASISKDDTIFLDSEDWEKYVDMVPNYSEKFIKCDDNSLFFNLSKFDFIGGVIINLTKTKTYSMEDINILSVGLSSLSSQLTILNQNEHLLMISSMDQLSKLKNRRALQEKLSTESEMIRRYQGKHSAHFQTSVTFIDLDHFKYYNDNYGHEAGDILIAEFSDLLQHIYRRVDFISRFGGDEFVILLPNTTDEEALRASERLREGLENANYFLPVLEKRLGIKLDVPKEHYLNFSAGICSNFVVEDKTDMSSVMQNADKALFAAKNSGRSRTVLWTEMP
ncbi:MAG: GGDEF domain-containing protein [Treponemataceae bacterium]|nr:GGDEF domain-containing protein [Treponemataceae bacterium]